MTRLHTRRRQGGEGVLRPPSFQFPFLLTFLFISLFLFTVDAFPWGNGLIKRRSSSSSSSSRVANYAASRIYTPRARRRATLNDHNNEYDDGDDDDDQQQQPQEFLLPSLLRSHAKLMKEVCDPTLEKCRLYLPSIAVFSEEDEMDVCFLSDDEFMYAMESSTAVDGTATTTTFSGARKTTRAASPYTSTTTTSVFLLPLRDDLGWLVLDFKGSGPTKKEWQRLESPITCLSIALQLAAQKEQETEEVLNQFAQFLQRVRAPLGALRTFGKLLVRRLERDPEGLTLDIELAKNLLIQSDELVELVQAPSSSFSGEQEEEEEEEVENGRLKPPGSSSWEALIEELNQEEKNTEPGMMMGKTKDGKVLTRINLKSLFSPIIAKAELVGSRDGINFSFFYEEGLPSEIFVSEGRRLQEILGQVVELALALALKGDEAMLIPAVHLEIRRARQGENKGNDGVQSSLAFIVRSSAAGGGGKEFERIRTDLDPLGGSLEVRPSNSMRGTHACAYIKMLTTP